MSTTDDRYSQSRTLVSMLKGLVSDVSILFRQEIELAKTEATERVESAVRGRTAEPPGLPMILFMISPW